MRKNFRSSVKFALCTCAMLGMSATARSQTVTGGATTLEAHKQEQKLLSDRLAERRAATIQGGTLMMRNGVSSTGIFKISGNLPTEKGTYLGVAGSPVIPALREQLKLNRGTGILVEQIESDSPAELAGVKQYDVLEKLDDQILINGQQLAVLVRLHKPDEEVKLSIVRQGQRQVLTAKLVEKNVPVLDEESLWGMPGTTEYRGASDTGKLTVQTTSPVSDKLGVLMSGNKTPSVATLSDDRNNYLITSGGDGTFHIMMMNKSNEKLFEGPADGELPATIPSYVKDMITKMKAMKVAPAAQPQPAP